MVNFGGLLIVILFLSGIIGIGILIEKYVFFYYSLLFFMVFMSELFNSLVGNRRVMEFFRGRWWY